LKKLIIVGSSGFVGKSLNEYIRNNKTTISRIYNYSRSEKKNFFKQKKIPVSDYIIYCINKNDINKSLRIFFHFKKLLKGYSKNVKIIFFSSGAVYGPRSKNIKFNEKNKITNNYKKFNGYKRTYAKEKIVLEKEFKKISKEGYNVSIVRGFTFYGKHILKYNYLISQIVKSIKLNKKMSIENQNVYRSYMHSDDMCKWILKILKNASSKCDIFNIGSDKSINIKNFIKFFNKNYDAKIKIKKNLLNKTDFYVPSTSLVRKKLKLKNTINFNHAIKSLVNKI
jgi:nucleoside-diphosphate-sugar epimerase|tara:strand:+ start:507 stop:1352 length:846 start_codon:yes stop_codon:yes gene_type:complete